MVRALAALLVAPLALAACKRGGASTETDASVSAASVPTLGAGELCETVFGAAARQLAARCTPEDQQKKQHGYLTGLASGPASHCQEELEPLVARGSVRLDAAAARRCGSFLEATSWKQTLASPDVSRFAECRGLILGTRTEGQPCESGMECGAGLTCIHGGGDQGRCDKPGGAAPACRRSTLERLSTAGACGPGAYCPGGALSSTTLGAPASEPGGVPAPASAATDRPEALREAAASGLLAFLGVSRGVAGIDLLDRPEETGAGGLGLGQGRPRGSPRAKAPAIRAASPTTVGRLPAEVVQRVVRGSFGRFRLCYEIGLRDNPALTGRVVVKFVINRTGDVGTALDMGSDLPDPGVVACVIRSFQNLVFPAPDGGIVMVTYPVVFSPGEETDAKAAPAASAAPAAEGPPSAAPAPVASAPAAEATCAPALAAGQDCTARDACAEGLACRLHRCSSDPPAEPGGACMEQDDCRPELYCRRALGPMGVCAAHKPEGAACTSSLQCGGLCLAGKCAAFCGAR